MNTFHNNNTQLLITTYGQWLNQHMAYGWNGFFLTFMFGQMPGSENSRMLEMKKQLGWFYGRLAKASVPRPSQEKWSGFLPQAVLVPDFPVFKHVKQNLRDFTVNNGLHWHGLVLQHPLQPKLQEALDVHV